MIKTILPLYNEPQKDKGQSVTLCILYTLMSSFLFVVGPESAFFSCSGKWIALDLKLTFVALSAFGFFLPIFS